MKHAIKHQKHDMKDKHGKHKHKELEIRYQNQ